MRLFFIFHFLPLFMFGVAVQSLNSQTVVANIQKKNISISSIVQAIAATQVGQELASTQHPS